MKRFSFLVPFVVLLVSCGSADSDSVLNQDDQGPAYLALGDSIAFGHNPLIPYSEETVAEGLYVGYPEVVASRAHLSLTNVACRGETTGSFIDKTAKDNGCHSGDEPADLYLKVKYDVNQLDFAVDFLKTHPDTKLVTLTIGGNDVLLVESECNEQAIPLLCKATKIVGVALNVAKNINKIVDSIRKSGYQGQIIFVTQYARNFTDKIQTITLGAIQTEVKILAKLKKFDVASGFDAFKKATADFEGDSCKAGLIILLEDGTCNQHPSQKGRELLGQTVLDLIRK